MKCLLLMLAFPPVLVAAPVPATKAKPDDPVITVNATYTIHWFGDDYEATFHPTGLFTSTSKTGTEWLGMWKLEGKLLLVDEIKTSEVRPFEWPPKVWTLRWSINMDVPGGRDLEVGGSKTVGKATITRKK